MDQKQLNRMVGKVLTIRGATHLCLASGRDTLLLLQLAMRDEVLFRHGDPVQYIVANHPDWHEDQLVWGQGEYYPLLAYRATDDVPASVQALKDAVGQMMETQQKE